MSDNQAMLYSVTGATGFVGGALVRLLVEAGHEVLALARDPGRAAGLGASGVSVIRGDLGDAAALDRLCDGVDGLFHVAAWYHLGRRDQSQAWRTNVDGTRNVIAAARRARVPRLVYTSTLAVNSDTGGRVVDEAYRFEGKHVSVYDETKARAHEVVDLAVAEGLAAVIVMPGAVYGPGDTSQTGELIRAAVRGRRPLIPAGGRLCWAHVDDVAAGHLAAMERGADGESHLLAGEQASLAQVLGVAAELAGTKGPIVLPTAGVRVAAAVAAVLGRVLPLPPTYAAETLRASVASYLGSAAKANRELGWTVRSLRDGIADVIAHEAGAPISDDGAQPRG